MFRKKHSYYNLITLQHNYPNDKWVFYKTFMTQALPQENIVRFSFLMISLVHYTHLAIFLVEKNLWYAEKQKVNCQKVNYEPINWQASA